MNNYDEQHIEQNIEDYIDGNNYDSINYDSTTRLLFIIMFFFGHILFYYASYSKYQTLTYEDDDDDDEILTPAIEETLQEEVKQPPHVPYEEKYLIKVRSMKNEYVFTREELELEKQKLDELKQEENEVTGNGV